MKINEINEILNPYRKPFYIPVTGSPLTYPGNTGRVGFFVESLFDIKPNNLRTPDTPFFELKTIRNGGSVSICTMSEKELLRIHDTRDDNFFNSEPYQKMQKTLYVKYEKIPFRLENTYYRLLDWSLIDFDQIDIKIKKTIQGNYASICRDILCLCQMPEDWKNRSAYVRGHAYRNLLTLFLEEFGTISYKHLALSYKGKHKGYHTYPSWSFKSSLITEIFNTR